MLSYNVYIELILIDIRHITIKCKNGSYYKMFNFFVTKIKVSQIFKIYKAVKSNIG